MGSVISSTLHLLLHEHANIISQFVHVAQHGNSSALRCNAEVLDFAIYICQNVMKLPVV